MVQPVERGGCEYKFARQYPALEQYRNRIADGLAGLLGGGHRTLLSILENQRAQKNSATNTFTVSTGVLGYLLKTLPLPEEDHAFFRG